MPTPSLDPELRGRVLGLLSEGYTITMVLKSLMKDKIKIARSTVSRLRSDKSSVVKKDQKKKKKRPILRKMSAADFKNLKKMAAKPNPPTQRTMAKILKVTQPTIHHHIHLNLDLVTRKKPKVHFMTAEAIEKRRVRSWPFYRSLAGGRYKFYITVDEALFRLSDFNRPRDIQYVKRGKEGRAKLKISSRKKPHSKGVMVWAGISSRGKTKLRFVSTGAKINSITYIEILKKFLKEDAYSLYPEGNFLLHQDSAPSHTSGATRQFLDSKIAGKYVTKEEWIPNSPDVAPMDYFVWGWMRKRVETKKVSSIGSLKRALKQAWDELPQEYIDNALASWPRRIYMIYKAKGNNIEQYQRKGMSM